MFYHSSKILFCFVGSSQINWKHKIASLPSMYQSFAGNYYILYYIDYCSIIEHCLIEQTLYCISIINDSWMIYKDFWCVGLDLKCVKLHLFWSKVEWTFTHLSQNRYTPVDLFLCKKVLLNFVIFSASWTLYYNVWWKKKHFGNIFVPKVTLKVPWDQSS